MHSFFFTIAVAVIAAALLMPGVASAGASASAPSKYAHRTVSQQQTVRQSYPITEYSSSARRNQRH